MTPYELMFRMQNALEGKVVLGYSGPLKPGDRLDWIDFGKGRSAIQPHTVVRRLTREEADELRIKAGVPTLIDTNRYFYLMVLD